MGALKETIYEVFHIGLTPEEVAISETDAEVRKIILSNKLLWILSFITSQYIVWFYLFGAHLLSYIAAITTIIYFIGLFLNHIKQYTKAKILTVLTTNSVLLFYSSALGKSSGVYMVYFSAIVIPLVLFNFNQKKWLTIGMILPVICSLILEILNFKLFPVFILKYQYLKMVYYTAIFSTFTISAVTVQFFYTSSEKAERKLQKTNDDLSDAIKSLEESQATIESLRHHATLGTIVRGIAHEVKNPIASIQASCSIILKTHPIQEKTREKIGIILHHIKQLGTLTRTLLRDSGVITSTDTVIHIEEIMDQVLRLVENEAYVKKIKLIKKLPEFIPSIKGNSAFITQALINLYINALQYTPENGEIKTTCEQIDKTLEITITDTGPGLRDDIQTVLFNENTTTGSRENLNAGLGLFFVKKVMEAHNGSVRTNIQKGKGASFTLIFPV